MLRVALFGASNLHADQTSLVQPLPELLGPLYDYAKQFKLALQAELNAPAVPAGSATLLSFARSLDAQIADIADRTFFFSSLLSQISSEWRAPPRWTPPASRPPRAASPRSPR